MTHSIVDIDETYTLTGYVVNDERIRRIDKIVKSLLSVNPQYDGKYDSIAVAFDGYTASYPNVQAFTDALEANDVVINSISLSYYIPLDPANRIYLSMKRTGEMHYTLSSGVPTALIEAERIRNEITGSQPNYNVLESYLFQRKLGSAVCVTGLGLSSISTTVLGIVLAFSPQTSPSPTWVEHRERVLRVLRDGSADEKLNTILQGTLIKPDELSRAQVAGVLKASVVITIAFAFFAWLSVQIERKYPSAYFAISKTQIQRHADLVSSRSNWVIAGILGFIINIAATVFMAKIL